MTPRNHKGLYSGVADSFAKAFLALKNTFQKHYFKLISINLPTTVVVILKQVYDSAI
jgi:hypothetical protein